MDSVTPKFSTEDFLKCVMDLKARRIQHEDSHPRAKETIRSMRREFYYAVRHVFLEYLPLVDKENMEKIFSQSQLDVMRKYKSTPEKWNVHHQKSISWGGRNFNPELLEDIKKYPLTEEQKKSFDKELAIILEDIKNFTFPEEVINEDKDFLECSNILTLRFQMYNYLKDAQAQNKLEKTFCKLFKGFLILLPKEKHDKLESFIKLQKSALAPVTEGRAFFDKPPCVRIHYPVWDQIVYGGTTFKEIIQKEITANKNATRKNKEFRRSKLIKLENKESKRDLKKEVRSEFFKPYKASRSKKKRLREKALAIAYQNDD